MASSRDIKAGGAYVQLGVKDGISRAMKGIGAGFKASVATMAKAAVVASAAIAAAGIAIGAGIAYGAANAVKSFVDMGSALNDASARTGISVEALSELGYAAEQTGASAEALETGVRKMQRTIADAGAGGKEAKEALGDLGLTFSDLKDLKPEDQFKRVAAQLNKIEDPTKRAAAAMGVWSKSGTQLLPMAAEVEELTKEFRDLGLQMSTKDAKAADQLGDRFGTLQAVMKRASVLMGASLAPAVERVTNGLIRAAAGVAKWVDANRHSFRDAAIAAAKWLEWLGGKIEGFAKAADDKFGGLGDALMAGDFKTAGELAVAHLQSAFHDLKGWMTDLWNDIGGVMVNAQIRAVGEIEKIWERLKGKHKEISNSIGSQMVVDDLNAAIERRQDDLNAKASGRLTSREIRSMGVGGSKPTLTETTDQIRKEIDQLSKDRNAAMGQVAAGQAEAESLAADAVRKIDERTKEQLAAANRMTAAQKALEQAEHPANPFTARIEELNAAAAASREAAKWIPRIDDVRAWMNEKGAMPPTDVDDTIGDAVAKATTAPRGQFGANSIQALKGTDQIQKQIADAVKDTADNTEDLARAARRGAVFVQ